MQLLNRASQIQKTVTAFVAAVLLNVAVQADPPARGRIIVRFDAQLSHQGIQTIAEVHGGKVVEQIAQLRVHVIEVAEPAVEEIVEALKRNPNVEFVEVESTAAGSATTSDPYVANGAQWHLSRIGVPDAWNSTTGKNDIVVAVLDTGVQLNHPDLAGQLLAGYDFINNDSDPSDDHGHGTAVAGVVAAAGNNGIGVAGVAYGCKILPVKVLDATNYGSYSAIAKGITFAADQGVRIINASICGKTSSFTLQAAVDYAWTKNAIVFGAAGNEANSETCYPAACRTAVGVSALDLANALASFSSYGTHVMVSAPGKDILTTQRQSSYGKWYGTSFACPVVAGIGALMLSVNPQLSNSELVQILKTTADDLGPAGYDTAFGHGRVNAALCVAAAKATISDTEAPAAQITSPSAGSTVQGLVNVALAAIDNTGIARIELYIDGVLAGTSQNASASFQWDTTVTENGTYSLRAQAYDSAGNMAAAEEQVIVSNVVAPDTLPPTTRITSPKMGARMYSAAKVRVKTADDVGVARVELYVNKKLYASSTEPSPLFTWKIPRARGTYNLRAIAYDAAGNAGSSKVIRVVK
jgi:thermitase